MFARKIIWQDHPPAAFVRNYYLNLGPKEWGFDSCYFFFASDLLRYDLHGIKICRGLRENKGKRLTVEQEYGIYWTKNMLNIYFDNEPTGKFLNFSQQQQQQQQPYCYHLSFKSSTFENHSPKAQTKTLTWAPLSRAIISKLIRGKWHGKRIVGCFFFLFWVRLKGDAPLNVFNRSLKTYWPFGDSEVAIFFMACACASSLRPTFQRSLRLHILKPYGWTFSHIINVLQAWLQTAISYFYKHSLFLRPPFPLCPHLLISLPIFPPLSWNFGKVKADATWGRS